MWTSAYPVLMGNKKKKLKNLKPSGSTDRFYAVAVGRTTGIFHQWSEAFAATDKFSGSCHRAFDNLEDAQTFLSSWHGDHIATMASDISDETMLTCSDNTGSVVTKPTETSTDAAIDTETTTTTDTTSTANTMTKSDIEATPDNDNDGSTCSNNDSTIVLCTLAQYVPWPTTYIC